MVKRQESRFSLKLTTSSIGVFFFFQAEDGIRDLYVTGVQTWLFRSARHPAGHARGPRARAGRRRARAVAAAGVKGRTGVLVVSFGGPTRPEEIRPFLDVVLKEIGRASCRGRVWIGVGAGCVRGRTED